MTCGKRRKFIDGRGRHDELSYASVSEDSSEGLGNCLTA